MRQQVNLYQPIFRRQEKKFSAEAMLQATGAVVAGVVLLYAYTQWQVSSLRREVQRADQQYATVTKRLTEVSAKFSGQARGVSISDEIARLERKIAEKQRVQEILQRGIFSNPLGFSDYFVSFPRQYTPGVWITGFDIVGGAEQLSLQGRSTNPELVPRYVQRLASEKRLAGIEFQVFQMSRAGTYVDFTLKTAGAHAGATP